ncbi:protease complex subunit PrcB family protein [Bacillus sp. FJAT-45350]|uniref:protease complex subunit PrcB family protein n=1 Tax=Bacillus sp. FJAT-45350 TaxID=2011014 RepID=UPI000BB7CC46|nr:protease complex subunit PrcB family protein [Bacillus sp. FJAT-45350]
MRLCVSILIVFWGLFTLGGLVSHANTITEDVTYLIEDEEIKLSWGEKPTSGYDIQILDLEFEENNLSILYRLIEPNPDEHHLTVITYPTATAKLPVDKEKITQITLMDVADFIEKAQTKNVEAYKTWSITFNQELDYRAVTQNTLFVVDSEGERVDNLVINEGKTIRIHPPFDHYEYGETYTLYGTQGLTSVSGNQLNNGFRMSFTIRTPKPVPSEDDENTIVLTYSFNDSLDGWISGFSDLPVDYNEELYDLRSGHEKLPEELQKNKYGFLISGQNASDDLFMFLKRKVGKDEGLEPHTTYDVRFEVHFATNAPANAFGIGGAPGESVYVKAGATVEEPIVEAVNGYYELSIDKDNQAGSGTDAIVIGNVAKQSEEFNELYELKTTENLTLPVTLTTNEDGEAWIIVGTDSGFEGTTALYYTTIKALFTKIEPSSVN